MGVGVSLRPAEEMGVGKGVGMGGRGEDRRATTKFLSYYSSSLHRTFMFFFLKHPMSAG